MKIINQWIVVHELREFWIFQTDDLNYFMQSCLGTKVLSEKEARFFINGK